MMKPAIIALLTYASVATAQTTQAKAFTGATLIDGTERAPVPNATIIVRDGRIVAAGPAGTVDIPNGAQRVSIAGKAVIPGIINAHA